jgi:hypothetical protein
VPPTLQKEAVENGIPVARCSYEANCGTRVFDSPWTPKIYPGVQTSYSAVIGLLSFVMATFGMAENLKNVWQD